MREFSDVVRVEKHRLENGAVALTFSAPEESAGSPHAPFAFVLHGLQSRKERHLDLCLRLARAGFTAGTLDVQHHGDRATPEASHRLSDVTAPAFLSAFAEAVIDTVADVRAFADYFGLARYALVGHSLGGFIALHTALSDDRAAVLVNISGSLDLSTPPVGLPVPPEVVAAYSAFDPVTRASELANRAILLLHGDTDATVPVTGARRLHAALAPRYNDSARLALVEYPGVGHEFLPQMADAAVEWLVSFHHVSEERL